MKNRTLAIFAALALAVGAFVVFVDSSRANGLSVECDKYGTCHMLWNGKAFAKSYLNMNTPWEVTNQGVLDQVKDWSPPEQ